MRITTWNVNSVRLREPLLFKLLEKIEPDILCLQETKCTDDQFPTTGFIKAGYPHITTRGMKGYNGVAIISRLPFEETGGEDWVGKQDCRHVSVRLTGGLELHNFYVPAGGDDPDPKQNGKFDHKLKFLDEMHGWFGAQRLADAPMVLVGDLNIAPLENDVWSHKQLLKAVSHTPVEVKQLNKFKNGLGWIDTTRHVIPEPEKVYSWWSYRARNWSAADRGRRLDHIWVTPPLKARIQKSSVLREARGWEKPSDHAPVTTVLE
ncbi:MAG: exodeoxyribonuclease III [Rhodospirillaceae bacterium]|nr:exodeoxyribonuclease III [Rhodospirillaceae bacterium]